MTQKLWCMYHLDRKGNKSYDVSSLCWNKHNCIECFLKIIGITKWQLKEDNYWHCEKVTVTIETFKK